MRSLEVLEGAHQCHFLFKLYLDQYETLISVYLFNISRNHDILKFQFMFMLH